jgi:hypothetical protein
MIVASSGLSFTAVAETPDGDVDVVAFASRWQLEVRNVAVAVPLFLALTARIMSDTAPVR